MYFSNTPAICCDVQFFAMRDGYRAAALADSGRDLHTHRNGREMAGAFSGPGFAWCAIAFTFIFYQRTGISNGMRFELNSGNRSRTPRFASLATFTFVVVKRF